ncbi:MAG: tRNA epoxyqueuosine(34) reductase QueG [Verrucomicrobia bacterium]|nr:tRNA epoxyqueuosine(34) reductase QueG [Verrucomicrobiota bacterium]
MTLSERIKNKALSLGFDLIGIAPAREARHKTAFLSWLDQNLHADMKWIERNPDRRADPRLVVDDARSVIAVGVSYFVCNPPPGIWNDPSRGRIARYAWVSDYHKVIEHRLKELSAFLQNEAGSETKTRYYVDTGPILERDNASLAGLGFIGRNSMLISPSLGSYVFLGEIIASVELEYDEPTDDEGLNMKVESGGKPKASCGKCRRCLDVCPTHALPAPYVVDSSRCISYLTIECRDAIPPELRPKMGNWIFGCDECQQICPWVHRYSEPKESPFLSYDPERVAPRLVELMSMEEQAFRERFAGSPVMRAKYRGLMRNAAVAMGNWGSEEALPVLNRAARHDDVLIREHATWAIQRISAG